MKRTNLLTAALVLSLFSSWTMAALAASSVLPQAQAEPTSSNSTATVPSASKVSHATKAINYLQKGAVKVGLHATDLMPGASAEAKVQAKSGRTEVEIKADGMAEPTGKFGFEYLTYVVWALSPQGRAANLGELILNHGSSKIRATTELQTFALIVTAEPYFAVTQPSNLIVLENDTQGEQQADIDFTYELLGRDAYSASNERIENAIFGIDPRTPLALFEARNAVRIAHLASADKYASAALTKAVKSLQSAENSYRSGNKNTTIAFAREAAQIAEDARVMSVKQQEHEQQQRQADEREAKARAEAEAEARRRQQAEQAQREAEAAKAEAERMKQEAEKARADAEAARAAAEVQQQQLAAEAEKARRAAEEANRLRQQAEKEKADLRARLLQQLNSVLETRDSARGLIANMGDVLFETGKYELKPTARERLARVSGLLLAYSGLKVAVEGHTDDVGSEEYNQKLSEQRAEAVRSYFLESGVPEDSVTARGFGKTQPVASNDTAEGRQKNRRVELVVSGDAIGDSVSAGAQN